MTSDMTFSVVGSNCRDAEEEMTLHWGYFLRDVERGLAVTEDGVDLSICSKGNINHNFRI